MHRDIIAVNNTTSHACQLRELTTMAVLSIYIYHVYHAWDSLSLLLSLSVCLRCVLQGKRWRSEKMYVTSRNIRLVMLPPNIDPMQAMKKYVRTHSFTSSRAQIAMFEAEMLLSLDPFSRLHL